MASIMLHKKVQADRQIIFLIAKTYGVLVLAIDKQTDPPQLVKNTLIKA